MAVDYSAYKLATASSVMSASNWNAFWELNLQSAQHTNHGYLYNIADIHNLDAKATVPTGYAKADGNVISAVEWDAIIDWIYNVGCDYYDNVCHPVYQSQLETALVNLQSSSVYGMGPGDSITTTMWNTLLDQIKAIVDLIDLSENVWTFGSAMPIVLV